MARPREFNEGIVLDAALQCFWRRGYDSTSVRDLIGETGLTGASLYNAFGDKHALYQKALDRYVETSIVDRIRRCERLAPLDGIEAFFAEVVKRSLADQDRKGCMLINATLGMAPHDPDSREGVAEVLKRIERFFLKSVESGQAGGTISTSLAASDLAQHLLSVLVGIRVLARVRPERSLLRGTVVSAMALLRNGDVKQERPTRKHVGSRSRT